MVSLIAIKGIEVKDIRTKEDKPSPHANILIRSILLVMDLWYHFVTKILLRHKQHKYSFIIEIQQDKIEKRNKEKSKDI